MQAPGGNRFRLFTLSTNGIHAIPRVDTLVVIFYFCFSRLPATDLCHEQLAAWGLRCTRRIPRPVQVQLTIHEGVKSTSYS